MNTYTIIYTIGGGNGAKWRYHNINADTIEKAREDFKYTIKLEIENNRFIDDKDKEFDRYEIITINKL